MGCNINESQKSESASSEQLNVKMWRTVRPVISCLKRGINKKNGYISPICPEAPHVWISTKFCTAVEVVDVITCDKFFSDRLRDVNSVGGFPLTKPMAVNTGLAQLLHL